MAATIGDAAGANGTLNVNVGEFKVTGSDPVLLGQFIIGRHGTGTLNINNGADVNVTGHNSHVSLGRYATGVGVVDVSGTGSTWTNNDRLWVGEAGTGTFTIQTGGSLITNSLAGSADVLGTNAGANSSLTVTGAGSTWTSNNELRVGNAGNGVLTVTDGGSMTNNNPLAQSSLGGTTNASGTATVTGPGSTCNTSGLLRVGFLGPGAPAIQAGGHVSSASGRIGGLNTGSGQVEVTGAESTWTVAAGLTIGFGEPEPGYTNGPGALIINGGTVSVAQDIDLNAPGALQFQDGTLTARSIGLMNMPFLGQFQWSGGTLHVETFRGNLTNPGGVLAPGHSAGTTTINGRS